MTTFGSGREGISESCYSLLLTEAVDYFSNFCEKEEASSTYTSANQTLELIGFRVGQSLMEK